MNLDDLTRSRRSIKGGITRLTNFIDNFDISTGNLSELIVREEQLKIYFNRYDEVQMQLEQIDFDTHSADRDLIEPKYYTALSKIRATKNSNFSQQSTITQTRPNASVKLPTLNIPQFGGDYHSWSSFKDLFVSLVHNDTTLSPVQKLCYLKSSLKNEPRQIIDSLKVENDNYEPAWKLLNDRYDNKYLIVNSHIKAILELTTSNKNTVAQLRELVTVVKQHLNALKSQCLDVSNWDILIIFILNQKVDIHTRKAWELQRVSSELPNLNEYFSFLEHRCNALELSMDSNSNKKTAAHVSVHTSKKCMICQKDHFIQGCPTFLKQTIEQRRRTVNSLKLCFNCLRNTHTMHSCRASSCRMCGRRHNTLLHYEQSKTNPSNGENVVNSNSTLENSPNNIALLSHKKPVQVLLCTARVLVANNQGKYVECRVLLDNGSQSNFVTESLVRKLNLRTYQHNGTVAGITDTAKTFNKAVSIQVSSRVNNFKRKLEFAILDKITCPLPHVYINTQDWPIPNNVQLADPLFYKPDEIEMLVGAELFFDILKNGHFNLGSGLPKLHQTQFGWIVSGNVPLKHNSTTCSSVTLHSHTELTEAMAKFWRLEELSDKPVLSNEEKQCERIFRETTTRNSHGRYQVELPLVSNYQHILGNSYQQALSQFYSLERRLAHNPQVHLEYQKFIDEYLALGHAVQLQTNEANLEQSVAYYMPHHAVIKPESVSTKLRVVFNASMPTTSGKSLNDVLLIGPTIQSDLFDIMLRFRTHLYVFTTDIVKMFRQIEVKSCHQPLQRILWRNKPSDLIQILQLVTVTYGTACAPYLAQKCLWQLAEDEGHKYPLASKVIKEDTYMDDVLSGTDSPQTLKLLQSELIELLKQGGFKLHKWHSNLPSLISEVESSQTNDTYSSQLSDLHISPVSDKQSSEEIQAIKALGLIWSPTKDQFSLSIPNVMSSESDTKRQVLSQISKIFDPLGLVTPVTIKAKLIMQRIWLIKSGWDECLPSDILTDWHKFKCQVHELKNIAIARSLFINKDTTSIQLHAFSDASSKAYGACVYLCVVYNSGTTTSNLICSKSRVAPLKTVSIPRLELCAAVLASKLTTRVYKALSTLKLDSVYLWTDSTIVLSWINSSSNKWSTFVAHRVSEIQELTAQFQWNHVSSGDNPADIISRGVDPSEIPILHHWWHGPAWLTECQTNWPKSTKLQSCEELPELRKVTCLTSTVSQWIQTFERFSNINRLIRTFAYVTRFATNCKSNNRICGLLSTEELDNSLQLILKLVQRETFSQEIDMMKQNLPLSSLRKSPLKQLSPFLDDKGLIRVGGRLKNANVPFEQKHPILLPSHHHVTDLIIRYEHIKLLHAGVQTLLANLRMKYWPINAKRNIKRVILQCVTCHRYKAPPLCQIMADLPEERVIPTRAFQCVGVDYAGPISIKLSSLRKSTIGKGYISVFVCLTTKAIHLELVSDLTTNAFLAALSRFVARRGTPSLIYSDNATNFRGAHNEMNRLYDLLRDDTHNQTISEYTSHKQIVWKFIPPNSPSWGGIWEAAVKSVKYHLTRIAGNSALTFEQLSTLLCKIESVLNSRPLCALSSDPNDYSYLSPSHFLLGDYMQQLPEEDLRNRTENSLKVYCRITQMRQQFWSKWSKDYLSLLQHRPKWQDVQPDLAINTLVLVRDDNLPPGAWALGRVVEVYPGADGRVRVALVKTASGTYKRPIVKLSPLPIQHN